jgi:hypothetical protein
MHYTSKEIEGINKTLIKQRRKEITIFMQGARLLQREEVLKWVDKL